METTNLTLPESLRRFVQERVERGGYGSVSDYLLELIRADQEQQRDARIDRLLRDGIESGAPLEATPEYWAAKRAKLLGRADGGQEE